MPDYSCYITIKNDLDCSLTFLNDGADHGYWNVNPPTTIDANTTSSQFQLKDYWGPNGTDGWVRYRIDLADAADDDSKPVIRVHFADPTGNEDNQFDSSVTVKNGSDVACYLFNRSNTDYAKRDHPLTVTLTISYNTSLATTSQLTSIRVPNPVVSVRNTKNVVNVGSNLLVWKSDNLEEYEDNSDAEVVGSYYPVAVDVASTSLASCAMDVYVNVVDQMLGVPFILYGGNDAAENMVSSDPSQALIFYTAGTQKIRVTVSPPWASNDTPWAVVGNISWRLKVDPTQQLIGINSTRLEFYAITKSLPSFYKNEARVTLLRRFVAPLRSTAVSWVDHCCQQTFTNFSFVYDSINGQASYSGSYAGGSFKLESYLSDIWTRTALNCYDQAGIMQICLGLSPTTNSAGYVFMGKFGFIVTTKLVGRGLCNNPFYLNSSYNDSIICDNNASDRSAFANHAFISLKPSDKDKIADTCCGYYNGSLNLQDYITASIQTENDTTLYRSKSMTPGTASNADFDVSGVTNLNGTTVTTSTNMMSSTKAKATAPASATAAVPSQLLPGAPPFLEGVERMIQLATAPGPVMAERRSNAALADFFEDVTVVRLGWAVARSSVASSADGTDAEWVLKPKDGGDDGDIVVNVFLAAGGLREATFAFGTHLGTYSLELDRVFQAPAEQRGIRGQLNLESIRAGDEGKNKSNLILLWVYGNVFVRIAPRFGSAMRVSSLADELHKYILAGAKPLDADDVIMPKIRKLSGPRDPVAVGETFVVHVSLEGKSYTTVSCKVGNVILMEHNQAEGYFKFYAAHPGEDTISFCFAHQSTLNSTARELDVTVMEA
ncbi:MAG: hypothetical protein Q9195_005452 [Heterodermia aff. obscurata]